MSKIENFGETRNVEITVLVDNRADLMPGSTDTVKRYTDEPLLAEHGFAALVELKDAGVTILWDAGITSIAFMENVKRMEIDLTLHDVGENESVLVDDRGAGLVTRALDA